MLQRLNVIYHRPTRTREKKGEKGMGEEGPQELVHTPVFEILKNTLATRTVYCTACV